MSRLLDFYNELAASTTICSTKHEDVRAALVRDAKRNAGIAGWNDEYSRRVTVGIHRAADKYLTPTMRARLAPRDWSGSLWMHLERNHGAYGLECRPCRRKIREALRIWEPLKEASPPYGCTSKSG